MKRPFSLAFAMMALGSNAAQAAPAPRCLNPAEMRGLIAYFLPEVVGEVTRNCAASLPAGSYLRTGLPRLGARLADAKAANWPIARAAFLKISDGKDAKDMARLRDDALRPMVDQVMAEKIKVPVDPATCGEVNDITEALAPLSAEQHVNLLATIFAAVARKDAKMRSCPREAAR